MTAARLRLGIVGAGIMGRQHAKACVEHGGAVVAIHDERLPAARELADQYPGVRCFDDLASFFEVPLDGVVIATPPPVRWEPIALACERGVHIMVEKPPALTLARGAALPL